MKNHPTCRENITLGPGDDTDFIHTTTTPFRHDAAIDLFAQTWPAQVLQAQHDSVFATVFTDQRVGNTPVIPEGALLLATVTSPNYSTSQWFAIDGLNKLAVVDGSNLAGSRTFIQPLRTGQQMEILRFLARPELCEKPDHNTFIAMQGGTGKTRISQGFEIDRSLVNTLLEARSLDLTPTPLMDGTWARVARGVYDGPTRGRGGSLRPAVVSELKPRHHAEQVLWEQYDVAPVGHLPRAMTERIVYKNEAEYLLVAFRGVDSGAQAITLEQSARGWNAVLYSEVLGDLVVRSGSLSEREKLLDRMKFEADKVLGLR